MDSNTLKQIEFFKSADIQTILNGKDETGTFYLNQLFNIYQEFFGETCSTCPSKILGYIQKVKSIKNNTMSQSERKYLLKEGAVIQVFGSSEAYSNANLTDEKAEKLLKENPNRSALFARIPEEFSAEKELSKMNKADLTAKALSVGYTEEDLKGLTNKDLVAKIEEKTAE
ncbi:hypothetical protein [Epilithonimonas sp. UC225_85]|uniref:hypothetical protein n=1 Tax=Epilithonimonas sp. UC225_85 TaxID=3350167 RepID=UPI0036D23E3C